jgi:hypothetical protein
MQGQVTDTGNGESRHHLVGYTVHDGGKITADIKLYGHENAVNYECIDHNCRGPWVTSLLFTSHQPWSDLVGCTGCSIDIYFPIGD